MSATDARPSVLRAGLLYTIANFASAGVSFLLLPLLTRVLEVSEYGQVVNFLMLVSLATAIAGLSLHGAVSVRWFSADPVAFRSFLSTCCLLIGVSTLAACLVVVGGVRLLHLELGLGSAALAGAALAAGATALLNVRLALLQAQRRVLPAASLQFGAASSNVLLSLVGVLLLGWGAYGRIGGIVASAVLLAAISLWWLLRSGDMAGAPTRPDLRAALRFGLPLIPHALAGVLMVTADRFVVADQLGTQAIGTYGVAAQLGMTMTLLGDAYVKTYGPWMYEKLSRDTERDDLAIVGSVYLAIPGFLGAGALLTLVLLVLGPWLLGTRFLGALPLVPWFMLGGAFNGIYKSVSGFFFFSNRTEFVSFVTVTAGLLGVAGSLLLVHRFGATGGAISFALTQGVATTLAFVIASRRRAMPWSRPREALAVVLGIPRPLRGVP